VVLREKIIRPLLAAGNQPEPLAKPANRLLIDYHCENPRAGMRDLFTDFGIAPQYQQFIFHPSA
jgi:hypothetical protein